MQNIGYQLKFDFYGVPLKVDQEEKNPQNGHFIMIIDSFFLFL
jgi:hypothetical protein